MKTFATVAFLAALPLLAACRRDAPPPPPAAEPAGDTASAAPATALGRTVAKAMEEARKELRTGNLGLNGNYDVRINGKRLSRNAGTLPPAHITPEGQLVVDGRDVAMDDASRALARDYRNHLIAIAETGMDLGVQGADLGMRAARDAIGSLLRGDTEEMEKRIEKEAKQLEASAMRICDDLPGLLDTQQALAAAVPAFVPYAKMESSDIADCHEGGVAVLSDEEAKAPTEAQPEAAPADAPPAKAP